MTEQLNQTLLITITTLAAVAVLLMLIILLIMLVRMKKPKKAKSVRMNQTPQVQSPIVPVHVTKTTTVLDEADAPGDTHNSVITLQLCFDQKPM